MIPPRAMGLVIGLDGRQVLVQEVALGIAPLDLREVRPRAREREAASWAPHDRQTVFLADRFPDARAAVAADRVPLLYRIQVRGAHVEAGQRVPRSGCLEHETRLALVGHVEAVHRHLEAGVVDRGYRGDGLRDVEPAVAMTDGYAPPRAGRRRRQLEREPPGAVTPGVCPSVHRKHARRDLDVLVLRNVHREKWLAVARRGLWRQTIDIG